ncbi:hypothetical protein K4A83_13110 [Spirulina subsalsa FACHB-351]|uniref:Lipoprotein n=2 Tax=Spirulina subsalsa TaxID=54311 RepID=A0ABT3L6R4_9CYAN|nr:hypothetical protein [Spirulina subsalsa FACHB-351]
MKTLLVFCLVVLMNCYGSPAYSLPLFSAVSIGGEEGVALLGLDELPGGFQELPRVLLRPVGGRVEQLAGVLEEGGWQGGEVFVYFHPRRLELVLGMVGWVEDVGRFDAYLERFDDPVQRGDFWGNLAGKMGGARVSWEGYEYRRDLRGVGDRSTGMNVSLNLVHQGFEGEVLLFRRDRQAVLLVVLNPEDRWPQVRVKAIATQLLHKL